MAEIAAIKPNGFVVASTFSGCGGSSLGYRMAGFEVRYANEFVPIAGDSYAANSPSTYLDRRDIKLVQPADILKACRLKVGELDLFDGSPPCQAFSMAGKRESGWGDEKKYEHGATQKNEDLFFEYIRLLKGLQPKTFVAENVAGLVSGSAKGYFKIILRELAACGYMVQAAMLDAQWLGVPQMRRRVIFVGVRNDLVKKFKVTPSFPKPFPYRYSIVDACPWFNGQTIGAKQFGTAAFARVPGERPSPTIMAKGMGSVRDGQVVTDAPPPPIVGIKNFGTREFGVVNTKLPSPTICASGIRNARREWALTNAPTPIIGIKRFEKGAAWMEKHKLDEPIPTITCNGFSGVGVGEVLTNADPTPPEISKYAIGPEYDKLSPGCQSRKYFNLIRTDSAKPSPTILAAHGQPGIASPIHPNEPRKFSIPELRRLSSFPDDFELVGNFAQRWERIGNSVPPLMAKAIGIAVRDGILAKLK